MKKRTAVVMLFCVFLTGCKMPFEEVEEPKEISVVVEPTITEEEIIEEEEKTSEIEKEELTEAVEEVPEEETEEEIIVEEEIEEEEYNYSEEYTKEVEQIISYGDHLTPSGGVYWYGDQKETWYNLDMSNIVYSIQNQGWVWNSIADEYKGNVLGEYWIREDGCKMLGDYIMIAANLDTHPRGSLVMTSLGMGVVVDTGGFAEVNPLQVDIAVNW